MNIRGIGTAVPPNQVNQADSALLSERVSAKGSTKNGLVQRILRRTQVQSRASVLATGNSSEQLPFYGEENPSTAARMAEYARHASPLALAAVERALADAQIAATRITHLVTVCCTGFQAPGFDLALIKQLGLDPEVQRTHVGFMGCHGALNGLRVAKAFVDADAEAVVLLCAVELCSLHLYYGWDPEKVVANALFADGAAALIATAKKGEADNYPSLLASGSMVIPNTEELMHWQIGNHGFEMGLSAKVPEAVATQLKPWLERWLKAKNYSVAEIVSWAVHPGGPRLLQACANALELNIDQIAESQAVLREHGNMSSATILFIIDRLRSSAAAGPCVAMAFGPGLSAEVALLLLP